MALLPSRTPGRHAEHGVYDRAEVGDLLLTAIEAGAR